MGAHLEVPKTMMVRVLRTDVARMLLVQFLVPIMIAAGVVARRWGGPPVLLAVGAFYLFVMVKLWRARRRLGPRQLEVIAGRVRLGDVELWPADVDKWTLDGVVARVYGPITSWRLRAPAAHAAMMETLLARAFGTPLPLAYRGSPLARGIARSLSFVCVGSIGFGLGCEVPMLVIGGVLGGVVTFGYWIGLSQKVIVLDVPRRRGHE
jgi:hypothetical protein